MKQDTTQDMKKETIINRIAERMVRNEHTAVRTAAYSSTLNCVLRLLMLRSVVLVLMMLTFGANVSWGQTTPVIATASADAESPVYYFIQNYEHNAYYMYHIGGGNLNTRPYYDNQADWYFVEAGVGEETYDLGMKYYYIIVKDGTTNKYLYASNNTDGTTLICNTFNSSDSDKYKFRIVKNSARDAYNIMPKGSNQVSVFKSTGNWYSAGVSATDFKLAELDQDRACWNFVAHDDSYSWTRLDSWFKLSNDTKKYYYKIQNDATKTQFMIPNTDNNAYVKTTTETDAEAMKWYFLRAGKDDYIEYYYIVNAEGKYMYALGNQSTGSLANVVSVKTHTTEGGLEEDRFQFVICRADVADPQTGDNGSPVRSESGRLTFMIVPKKFKDVRKENHWALCYKTNNENLKSDKERHNNWNCHWNFISQAPVCEAPTLGYDSDGNVQITCGETDATIWYTTDGTDPKTSESRQSKSSSELPYSIAIDNASNVTKVQAYTTKDNYSEDDYMPSGVTTFNLTIDVPTFTYNAASNTVTITSTPGATIYYAFNDGTPSMTGTGYTAPYTTDALAENVTMIKAIARKGGVISSESTSRIIQASVGSAERIYLVQSLSDGGAFYMQPGDYNSSRDTKDITTSSIHRPSMQWYFTDAGVIDGTQYYYIINKETGEYATYYILGSDIVCLHDASTVNNEADKSKYRFSIKYYDTSNPSTSGFYMKPQNITTEKGLRKADNNAAGVIDVEAATNIAARWNIIPLSNKPATTHPIKIWGENNEYQVYKIKNAQKSDDKDYYVIPPTGTSGNNAYVNPSSIDNDNMAWYFEVAGNDGWQTYYHIINAITGEYLYFNGNDRVIDNNNAFITKTLSNTDAQRYQFTIANTKTSALDGKYYIVPRSIQDLTVNNYSLMYRDQLKPLLTTAKRDNDWGKWIFEESTVPVTCMPPLVSITVDGKLQLTPTTNGSTSSYSTDNGSTWKSAEELQLSEKTPTPILAKATFGGGDSSPITRILLYQPDIELVSDQSLVYNGTTHTLELSSVTYEDNGTNLKDCCVVTSSDIDASEHAIAVVTQKEDETEYVIYGTTEFTIEQSPLTITADVMTVEYGEQVPTELTFSTSGLAPADIVNVNLVCTPGESLGSYPITFSDITEGVKCTITRGGVSVENNYKDITFVPSSLMVVSKSLGDGTVLAEHISIDLTGDAPIVKHAKVGGEVTLTGNTDYTVVEGVENSRKEVICTIFGKGNYTGAAQVSLIKPTFVLNQGETTTEYIAAFSGSMDWIPAATAWDPTNGSKKVWILTSINPSLSIVQAKQVNYLPKDMPVLLTSGENETTTGINVSVKSSEMTPVSNADRNRNLLKMVPENEDNPAEGLHVKNGQVYVFYNNATNGTGEFVLALEGWLPSGKFYIDNPNYSPVESSGGSAPARLKISRGESTAISEIQNSITVERKDAYWYSIDGRRLNGKPTAKGLYIMNGKKVVLK